MEPKGKENEQYWLNEFIAGNNQALGYFYKLHYKPICYFATRLTQHEPEAKDIVTDTFVKLWEKHAEFETAANIKSFLYLSVRGACLNYLRDLKKRTAAQQLYFEQIDQNGNSVLHEIIEAEFLKILDREINLLPEKCKEVFTMLYFEGKKTDEIAAELEISVQTVRNHKTRAVELLKSSFLKKGVSGPFFAAFLIIIQKL
ncbi:RNA polymerase sigma-70 factor [Pedobacter sp. MC2016-14]|uniref:RNA polymerase sigma factor n=1 Tax=Pedobacter sp. MC2016-14 TaxID=2897327 RepID=UPI001E64050F|nr:RNA polymerase sigma-70 factor [Pedobacter sp. MC2016-14]MCD0487791.1 RNA polymerase sigma-70 factor [Pedobacter sp. MC2016-14]